MSASPHVLRLFKFLESRFGDLPSLRAADTSKVITLDKALTTEAFSSLVNHEALCVLVKGFIPPEEAERHAEDLLVRAEEGGELRDWKISTSRGEHPTSHIAVMRSGNSRSTVITLGWLFLAPLSARRTNTQAWSRPTFRPSAPLPT